MFELEVSTNNSYGQLCRSIHLSTTDNYVPCEEIISFFSNTQIDKTITVHFVYC